MSALCSKCGKRPRLERRGQTPPIRNFQHEYRAYFEVEKPQQIHDDSAFLRTA